MPTPPRKPVLPNVVLAAVLMVAVYVLSFGPYHRLMAYTNVPTVVARALCYFYWPLWWWLSLSDR